MGVRGSMLEGFYFLNFLINININLKGRRSKISEFIQVWWGGLIFSATISYRWHGLVSYPSYYTTSTLAGLDNSSIGPASQREYASILYRQRIHLVS